MDWNLWNHKSKYVFIIYYKWIFFMYFSQREKVDLAHKPQWAGPRDLWWIYSPRWLQVDSVDIRKGRFLSVNWSWTRETDRQTDKHRQRARELLRVKGFIGQTQNCRIMESYTVAVQSQIILGNFSSFESHPLLTPVSGLIPVCLWTLYDVILADH